MSNSLPEAADGEYRQYPPRELSDILLPSLRPCRGFENSCRGLMRWEPSSGHIPRGYMGALGALDEVRLIIVTAEPGDPADGETYGGEAIAMLKDCSSRAVSALGSLGQRRDGRAAPYHKALRHILDLCWPDLPFSQQLRGTWITQTVLCSARVSAGDVPRSVERSCVEGYLRPQIELLTNAFVIALGEKAKSRLLRVGVRYDASAQHPSARPNTDPEPTWRAAASAFQAWRSLVREGATDQS